MSLGGPAAARTRSSAAAASCVEAHARVLRWAVVSLTCFLLVSCGGEPRLVGPTAAAIPPSSPSASPAASPIVATPDPAIGDIVWTTSVDPATNAPVEAVSSYAADVPRIIAAMPVRELPQSAMIQATWEYNDTPLETFTTEIELDARSEPRWITFYLDREPDTLWPEGVYAIAVSLDGAVVQESTVEVVDTG